MVFLVTGRSAKNIEEKRKTGRRKTLKSEEREKWRLRQNSNNSNFAQKHNLKVIYAIKFYLQCLCVAVMDYSEWYQRSIFISEKEKNILQGHFFPTP